MLRPQAARRRLAADPYTSPTDPWYSTKACKVSVGGPNTVANITRDGYGRYWGFQDGGSCSFRGVDINALKYSQVHARLG